MAYECQGGLNAGTVLLPGLVAGAGLTGSTVQFKFVRLSADRTVILVSGTDQAPIGVLQEPVYATGDPVTVLAKGLTKVRMAADAGTPTAGNILGANADGQAAVLSIPAAAAYQAGVLIDAIAGAAVADGVIGTALVNCIVPELGK